MCKNMNRFDLMNIKVAKKNIVNLLNISYMCINMGHKTNYYQNKIEMTITSSNYYNYFVNEHFIINGISTSAVTRFSYRDPY